MSGGEGGIRTRGRALWPYDGLANRCLKPTRPPLQNYWHGGSRIRTREPFGFRFSRPAPSTTRPFLHGGRGGKYTTGTPELQAFHRFEKSFFQCFGSDGSVSLPVRISAELLEGTADTTISSGLTSPNRSRASRSIPSGVERVSRFCFRRRFSRSSVSIFTLSSFSFRRRVRIVEYRDK